METIDKKRIEVSKILYKEKPIARHFCIHEPNGSFEYHAQTSIGLVRFVVPVKESISEDGKTLLDPEMPAQLLIRWLEI